MRWEGYQILEQLTRMPILVALFATEPALSQVEGVGILTFDPLHIALDFGRGFKKSSRSPHTEPPRLFRHSTLSRKLTVIAESAVVHSKIREGGESFASFMDPIRNNFRRCLRPAAGV